ncbi:hypothetical protein F4808DRAFT_292651 [Astrocystis sublimbata]|nr:hypothetical protein F4808DRAFT_292651 [Astrocystis sublimbata]
MSTTPASSSPAQMPRTPERTTIDQSMLVEPPTEMGHFTQSHEDGYVSPDTEEQDDSAPPTQVLDIDTNHNENPNEALHRALQPHHTKAGLLETHKRQGDAPDMTDPAIAPFDWEDFEDRYQKALEEADENEKQLLQEFAQLVKYFNVWASASSTYDNERAVKRLQTRERYVALSEQSLDQKKQHLSEVVKAFQSALALLKAT